MRAGREYKVTVNSDSWVNYNYSEGNIFPTGDLYDGIEITGYGSISTDQQLFPTAIVRDQSWIAGIADVYFVPDL